jgi:hypothetical protein
LLVGYSFDVVLERIEQKAATILTGAETSDAVVTVNGSLWAVETEQQTGTANRGGGGNAKTATPNDYLKPTGIANFRRVEQTLKGYERDEIAYEENLLIGEKKERTTWHMIERWNNW